MDDLLAMAHDTVQMQTAFKLEPTCTAVSLSRNRLLLNDHVIYPNTQCIFYSNGNRPEECTFVSAAARGREWKGKKKEDEVSIL